MAKKNISTEDSDLFRQAIGPVSRVESDKISPDRVYKPKKNVRSNTAADDEWQRPLSQEVELVDHEQRLKFTAPGVQNKVLEKLRKGFFGIQSELDLHGLNSTAAQHQLLEFLDASQETGHHCVQIIHGKGYRSLEGKPVLKNHINKWLRQHKSVLAFCSTPQKHGGSGAVWVLLRTVAGDT